MKDLFKRLGSGISIGGILLGLYLANTHRTAEQQAKAEQRAAEQ